MVIAKNDVINFLLKKQASKGNVPMTKKDATEYVESAKSRNPRRTYEEMLNKFVDILGPVAPLNKLGKIVRESVPIAPSFSKFIGRPAVPPKIEGMFRKGDMIIQSRLNSKQNRVELPLRRLVINPRSEDAIRSLIPIYEKKLIPKAKSAYISVGFRYVIFESKRESDRPLTYFEAKAQEPMLIRSFSDYTVVKNVQLWRQPFNKDTKKQYQTFLDYLDYRYDNPYDSFAIVSVFVDDIERQEGGQGGQTYTQVTNKYYIISPESKTNCLFTSCAIGLHWQKNIEYLTVKTTQNNGGKELKRQVKPTLKDYADESTIQEICDYKNISIVYFNNIFEKKVFIPVSTKSKKFTTTIRVQLSGGHFNAMIKKSEVSTVHPNFKMSDKPVDDEPKIEIPFPIKKAEPKPESIQPFDEHKYVAWDLETFQESGIHHAYKAGMAYYLDGVERCKIFTGTDCCAQMMRFVAEHIEFFDGKFFYAHNGGKFDINILIKEALLADPKFKIDGKKCVELNNAWIGFRLSYDDKVIDFRDSFRMFMGSLDSICKDLKVPHQKLVGSIEYHKIKRHNFHEYNEAVDKYLTNDCLGLLEAVTIFGKAVFAETGIHIYNCLTSATLAKKSFYNKHYCYEKTPLYTMPTDMDAFVRDGYFGGMVQCFDLGHAKGKFYYYDFTSLYPSEGRKPLPFGKPVWKHGANINLRSFFGFVKCRVVGTEKMLRGAKPIHAIKQDGKLVFAYIENETEMTLFSEEIKYGLTLGYKYVPLQGIEFKSAPFLKKCFEEAFANKAKAESDGNPALVSAYKIIANSTYGFFGMRKNDRDGVIIGKDIYYTKYLDEGKLKGYGNIGNYDIVRVIKDLDLKDINVSVSAAISSYSRMKTHQLINDIEKKGGHVYYCDTDSVITDIPIGLYKEIQNKYQWDGTGNELGSVKNECIKKVKSKVGNDGLKIQTDIDGELFFDEIRIVGCKAYNLTKTLYNEKVIEINKLKGYSQRDFHDEDGNEYSYSLGSKDFDKMICGESISQKSMQFSCNKQAMLNESGSFNVKTNYVSKKFSMTYNKGSIMGQIDEKNRMMSIAPFVI